MKEAALILATVAALCLSVIALVRSSRTDHDVRLHVSVKPSDCWARPVAGSRHCATTRLRHVYLVEP